ncbi:MAG: FHA domain-containing protein, partial [Anaerolineales bacterium]
MNPEIVLLGVRLLLALALYTFLGSLLLFLRRDLRRDGRGDESMPVAHLVVEEGEETGKGFRLSLTNLIGRAADNTIRLKDTTVSSYHVRLSYQGGQWWLEDLGSRNGTGLNEIAVEEPMVVMFGDRIRLGRVALKL